MFISYNEVFKAEITRSYFYGSLKLEGFTWEEYALPFSHALVLSYNPYKFLKFSTCQVISPLHFHFSQALLFLTVSSTVVFLKELIIVENLV